MFYTLILGLFLTFTHSFASDSGVTKDKVIFGQSAAFTGGSSNLGQELWRGAQVYFDYINKEKGGVHGRKISIRSMDDGYEGSRTQLNTIKLISQEGVFNYFGYVGTPTIVKALPVLQKFSNHDVVLFSNFTGAQPQRELPHKKYVYNIRASYREETAGLVKNLNKIGKKRFGVFIQDDAYGRSGADGVRRGLEPLGLSIISEATYKRGTGYSSSMNEQVQKMLHNKVDAIISVGSYAPCAAFIRDARKAGFKGVIANLSFVGPESLLDLLMEEEKKTKGKYSITKKLINSQVVPPWDDKRYELVKEYRKLMEKYYTKVHSKLVPAKDKLEYSFVSLEGFLNAKALVYILDKVGPKLTRKEFIKTLNQERHIDLGLKTNIHFDKDLRQASNEIFFTQVHNNHYEIIETWDDLK